MSFDPPNLMAFITVGATQHDAPLLVWPGCSMPSKDTKRSLALVQVLERSMTPDGESRRSAWDDCQTPGHGFPD